MGYNNQAMDTLMGPDGSGSAGPGAAAPPPADDQQPEQADQSSMIQKVPGGYQVSVVVPTLEEAHALSQQFHAGAEDGKEAQPPGEGEEQPPAENEDASEEREGVDSAP